MAFKLLMVGFGKLSPQVLSALCIGEQGEEFALKCDVFKQTALSEQVNGVNKVFLGSVDQAESWRKIPKDYDALLYCLSPRSRSPEDYEKVFLIGMQECLNHFSDAASKPHIVFVSSTSVYGQDNGEWLTEDSPAQAVSATALSLVAAEQLLTQSDLKHTLVRFSGIYGGGRTRMLEQVVDQAALLSHEARISNRIHEADCVGFLSFLIAKLSQKNTIASCYLASDSEPCDLNEVYQFIAQRLNVSLRYAEPNVLSRSTGNKYCRNARMLSSGYVLKYPSFKEGYSDLIEQSRQRTEGLSR